MNKISWVLSSVLLAPIAFGQTASETTNFQPQGFETRLAQGATLRLHLHDGDFRVIGTDSDKILVRVEGTNAEQAREMKIRLDRSDTAVDLKLSHVPKKEVQVIIEIPKTTNLYARMRGGDLSIRDVSGDKDLELTAGDLT